MNGSQVINNTNTSNPNTGSNILSSSSMPNSVTLYTTQATTTIPIVPEIVNVEFVRHLRK